MGWVVVFGISFINNGQTKGIRVGALLEFDWNVERDKKRKIR